MNQPKPSKVATSKPSAGIAITAVSVSESAASKSMSMKQPDAMSKNTGATYDNSGSTAMSNSDKALAKSVAGSRAMSSTYNANTSGFNSDQALAKSVAGSRNPETRSQSSAGTYATGGTKMSRANSDMSLNSTIAGRRISDNSRTSLLAEITRQASKGSSSGKEMSSISEGQTSSSMMQKDDALQKASNQNLSNVGNRSADLSRSSSGKEYSRTAYRSQSSMGGNRRSLSGSGNSAEVERSKSAATFSGAPQGSAFKGTLKRNPSESFSGSKSLTYSKMSISNLDEWSHQNNSSSKSNSDLSQGKKNTISFKKPVAESVNEEYGNAKESVATVSQMPAYVQNQNQAQNNEQVAPTKEAYAGTSKQVVSKSTIYSRGGWASVEAQRNQQRQNRSNSVPRPSIAAGKPPPAPKQPNHPSSNRNGSYPFASMYEKPRYAPDDESYGTVKSYGSKNTRGKTTGSGTFRVSVGSSGGAGGNTLSGSGTSKSSESNKSAVGSAGDAKTSSEEKKAPKSTDRMNNKAVVWMRGEGGHILSPRRAGISDCGDMMVIGRPNATLINVKPYSKYCNTPAMKRFQNLMSPICELEQDRLYNEYASILDEYQNFFQQQFSFVRALEHARRPYSWDDAGCVEIRCMENVECYLHRLSQTGNALFARVMHLFFRLFRRCEIHFNNLLKFYQVFIVPNTPHDVNRSQALRNLNELKELLHRKFQFYDLRVSNPHQQVLRLSVDESKVHYGGAVSYLPIVLDVLDQTRSLMSHVIDNTLDHLDPEFEERRLASAPVHM